MVRKQANIQTFSYKETKIDQGITKMEDNTKKNPIKRNKNCNDWKIQIHWNKIESVNPNIFNLNINPFCT